MKVKIGNVEIEGGAMDCIIVLKLLMNIKGDKNGENKENDGMV